MLALGVHGRYYFGHASFQLFRGRHPWLCIDNAAGVSETFIIDGPPSASMRRCMAEGREQCTKSPDSHHPTLPVHPRARLAHPGRTSFLFIESYPRGDLLPRVLHRIWLREKSPIQLHNPKVHRVPQLLSINETKMRPLQLINQIENCSMDTQHEGFELRREGVTGSPTNSISYLVRPSLHRGCPILHHRGDPRIST